MAKFQYKFDDTDDCKLYVVSDLHLNHQKEFLWSKRGFKSAQEHTNALIDKINQTCRPDDILLNLGDFCLNTKFDDLYTLIDRINCQQWWICGNHNNPWQKDFQQVCLSSIPNDEAGLDSISEWFYPEIIGYKYRDKVTVWGHYLEFVWNRQPCTFFHYPIAVWNQMHHGAWALCGHSHYSYPLSRADNFEIKQLDCGWEGHNKPLSFEEIKKIMNKKKIQQKDHHNNNVN